MQATENKGKPILIAGLVMGAAVLALGLSNPAVRGVDAPPLKSATLFNGKWAEAFSKAFDEKLVIKTPSTNLWTAASFGLFHEGRDGVLIGSDNWLYTSEEFDTPRRDTGIAYAVERATRARQTLDGQGVRLVIAIVPAKSRIYNEHLGRYSWPSTQTAFYDDLVTGLREAGLTVVDLRPSLLDLKSHEPAYFRTDTHWTPSGAHVAAQTISAQVQASGGLKAHREGETLRVTFAPTKAMDGDLLTFIPLKPLFSNMMPPSDSLSQPTFDYVATGSAPAADLLGESATPVILVGTSYSADERWGFARFLEMELGADLVNVADKGAGPFVPMDKLLAGTTLAEATPELVIWEIPERYVWMTPNPTESSKKQ